MTKKLAVISAAIVTCSLLVPSVHAQLGGAKEEEYYQSFKGNPDKSEGWQRIGPEGEQCVKFEVQGLRITLPAGHEGKREDTGVVRGFAVKGDFEITLGYEILQEPAAG